VYGLLYFIPHARVLGLDRVVVGEAFFAGSDAASMLSLPVFIAEKTSIRVVINGNEVLITCNTSVRRDTNPSRVSSCKCKDVSCPQLSSTFIKPIFNGANYAN